MQQQLSLSDQTTVASLESNIGQLEVFLQTLQSSNSDSKQVVAAFINLIKARCKEIETTDDCHAAHANSHDNCSLRARSQPLYVSQDWMTTPALITPIDAGSAGLSDEMPLLISWKPGDYTGTTTGLLLTCC